MNIKVQRVISMGHRLPSYDGICSSMHGHNVRVEACVKVAESFLDFKKIDLNLAMILEGLDHAMVMYQDDPFVAQLKRWPQRLVLLTVEPTTEAIAQLVFNELQLAYDVESVVVYETDKYQAECRGAAPGVRRVQP